MEDKTRFDYKQFLIANHERIVIIASFIFLIAMMGFIINEYHDVTSERGFDKDAKAYLDKTKVYGFAADDYMYVSTIVDNVGVAYNLQNTDLDYVNRYRQVYMDKILDKVEPDENRFKAVFFNSSLSESDMNTISMLISYQIVEYDHNKKKVVEEGIKTWLFNKENGVSLAPVQLLKEDYRSKAARHFRETFEGKAHLAPDWEESVADDTANFNKFMVADNGIIFFFSPGEILTEDKGIVRSLIPYRRAHGWERSEILDRYIDPDKPMVALTYDDGPGGKAEAKIHKYLKQNGAVATFFYSGYMIKGKEDQIKDALDMGCEIGNHTWNHPVLTRCDDKDLKKQLNKTNKKIKKACGQYPTVFRPSYGATNKKVNKKANLPVIIWDIDTQDWKTRDAKKIVKTVTKKKKKLDGKIILMHSLYPETAKATKELLPWLEENGFQTVTVSELIRYRYGEEPKKAKVYAGWYD
ncbi:MAG: polysaccharide deacetylase family protein [Eubacterium sp.]|nr:polysaccharide deacetylase family protein [Candidatus Colimonas fimequi]